MHHLQEIFKNGIPSAQMSKMLKVHFTRNIRLDLPDTTDNSKFWTNPLQSPLPYAPSMKVFCLYGVNKPTERGFYYKDETLHPAGY